jgi:hypothetical protein
LILDNAKTADAIALLRNVALVSADEDKRVLEAAADHLEMRNATSGKAPREDVPRVADEIERLDPERLEDVPTGETLVVDAEILDRAALQCAMISVTTFIGICNDPYVVAKIGHDAEARPVIEAAVVELQKAKAFLEDETNGGSVEAIETYKAIEHALEEVLKVANKTGMIQMILRTDAFTAATESYRKDDLGLLEDRYGLNAFGLKQYVEWKWSGRSPDEFPFPPNRYRIRV